MKMRASESPRVDSSASPSILRIDPRGARLGLNKIALFVIAPAFFATPAHAQSWRVVPSIGLEETLTDNVNVVSKSSGPQSDLVTNLTPAITFSEKGGRTSLSGSVSLPILLYARTGAANNRVTPEANVVGNIELIDKFFFVDANALVSQEFFSPLGARPTSIESGSQNRYTAQTYSVSPYITSIVGRDLQYEVRDTSTWTRLNAGSGSLPEAGTIAYTNDASATLSKRPVPLGWDVSYTRSDVKFSSEQTFVTQIFRARGIDQVDPELQLFVTGGYENDQYAVRNFQNTIYGVGGRWQPNARMTVDGNWEHRFFGSAYQFSASYNRPLTTLSINASRDVSSLPQQLSGVPGSFDLQAVLNQLFLTQIPDPIQRQQFIDQYIRDNGLTQLVSGSVPLFVQQNYIVQQATVSLGLLGVRNTVLLTAYHSRTEAVTAVDAVNPAAGFSNNTQIGGGVSWTYNLGAGTAVTTSADVSHAVANGQQAAKSNQGSLRVSVSKSLSAYTSLTGGARYVIVRSDLSDNTEESAIFVGVTHTFK
jgi:uncharacterized protein (PEP-CTERM system associated)